MNNVPTVHMSINRKSLKTIYIWGVLITVTFTACYNRDKISVESHNGSISEEHHDEEEHEKIQYTAYTSKFEVFVEADAFIKGISSNILAHFTVLPGFQALDSGKVTIKLGVSNQEVIQTQETPLRKGIYSFEIIPELNGKGSLKFIIEKNNEVSEIEIFPVQVYSSEEEALNSLNEQIRPGTNTAVFTKEQSWKTEFATGFPKHEPFGPVIKTTAKVQSSQSNEITVYAQINGIVNKLLDNMLAGTSVTANKTLFSVSGGNLTDNISLRFAEASNNYEKAKEDFERARLLAKDKIVSEKELTAIKNQYENAKVIYNNLSESYDGTGQAVKSPMEGFINQVFVSNGTFVQTGQPLFTVSQNNTLLITAEVPQSYLPVLGNIYSANIHNLYNHTAFSLEHLHGKVLSYGKVVNPDNFLIPVNIQISNNGVFIPGSFVEVWFKTKTNNLAIVVPNTALIEEQGIFFVWVQITPELFEKREVSIGQTDGISTEILKGINPDERLVIKGAILIKLAQSTGTLDAHSGHVH